MKTYKTLTFELSEAKTSSGTSKSKKSKKDKIEVVSKKKKVATDDRPRGIRGILGSILSGAAAAAHRHLIYPAHAKYQYQPITDYMKGFGKKKKVYIETDD